MNFRICTPYIIKAQRRLNCVIGLFLVSFSNIKEPDKTECSRKNQFLFCQVYNFFKVQLLIQLTTQL